jgi:hypothetical protein
MKVKGPKNELHGSKYTKVSFFTFCMDLRLGFYPEGRTFLVAGVYCHGL